MAARSVAAAKFQRNNLRNNIFVQHNPTLFNFYNTLPFRAFASKLDFAHLPKIIYKNEYSNVETLSAKFLQLPNEVRGLINFI